MQESVDRDRDDVLTLLIHLGYLACNEETQRVRIPNEDIRLEFAGAIRQVKRDDTIRRVRESEQICGDRGAVMRNIEDRISEKLDEIEEKEGVRILHAVESGSRAWGFASPDSDYDVRFIYVRPHEDYLRIDEPRDVIEWQLDEVFDINGWDLKKALRQFARGNATLFEWSGSLIVYRSTEEWGRIKEISGQYFSEKAAVYHYYGTANNTLRMLSQMIIIRTGRR